MIQFAAMDTVERLHQRILCCRSCQDAGYIERAAPVIWGRADDRMMLVGQAPGITELEIRRPFQGRAGKELFRWLGSIGIEEEEFRSRVYMTAVTKCYPGRLAGASGDRRPSQREIELCRPWLAQQLALVQPRAVLLVGGLAIEQFFPPGPLTSFIGKSFEKDGMVLVPLPHPSGASRWLNAPEHKQLLRSALEHVRLEWESVVPACPLPHISRV